MRSALADAFWTTPARRLIPRSGPYSAATGMRRSPSVPTSVTSAPSVIRTGAVSEDERAQQTFEPGATRQMSPSFFMQ